jgi:hypothetical protein
MLSAGISPFRSKRVPGTLVLGPIVQNGGIKVGAIFPNECPELGIEMNGAKHSRIAKRPVKFTPQDGLEIDQAFRGVIESNPQAVIIDELERDHMMKRMRHGISLTEGLDGGNPPPGLQSGPIVQQLGPMQFRPSLDESPLANRQRSGKGCQVINGEYSLTIGRYHVEMRAVMSFASFDEHPNDKPIESRQFRHTDQGLEAG